jgi:hypothetical protein
MNTKVPYKFEDIDLNKIKYTNVKSNVKKTVVYLKYLDNNKLKNLVFQSPSLLNINKAIKKNNFYDLDIPLVTKNVDKTDEFITFLNNIDHKVIKDATNNKEWFNNLKDTTNVKYQKIIRKGDNKYPNMIRLKIVNSNNFETVIQLNNKKNINAENIPIDSWSKIIFELYAIWINNDGFGVYLRPILISFTPNNKIDYNYKILEDSDDIDDIINTVNDNSIFIKSEPKEKEYQNQTSILELPSNEVDNYYKEISDNLPINTASSDSNIIYNENISSTSSE